MGIGDWLPQLIILLIFGSVPYRNRNASNKDFWYTIVGLVIFLGLLVWGGFFDGLLGWS